jgi:aminoglycoside 2''-phosphotransferase
MVLESDQQTRFIETIHTTYPGMNIRSARQLTHDGEFNDILIVNDDLVFRFPRYAENIPGFLREIQLLALLQNRLPLPIPNPIYTSGTSTQPGKVFMGYRLISGVPLSPETMDGIKNAGILHELAEQLANFLSVLHDQIPAILGLDLPVQHMPDWIRAFYHDVRNHLFPLMRPDACLTLSQHFDAYFNTPLLQGYQAAIIHGDFGGSNLLFDDNRISGILDFSSVVYSDPALDIASVSTYGELFFSHFCQFYTVTEESLNRAKFYRGIFAVEEAWYGWRNNDKSAFERGMQQYI